ncbi:3-hydroxyisobutyrate dehydrogenase-related [Desulfoluna spongiiphila]|nr:3-hydroxyisobutyrate dehydrogenase-related [Desulfoluna spongiiphila]
MKQEFRIGFIGLGKMGSAICAHILKEKYQVSVYNRTCAKAEPFVRKGAAVVGSPREAAEKSDIVLTSLMDDASVFEMCAGDDGVIAGLKPGGIHIGLTTILPSTANKLRDLHKENHTHYLAAPVLGRPDAAAAGSLISILGGDSGSIETVRPIVDCYSNKIIPIHGAPGRANALKVCVNYFAMTQMVMFGEVFAFTEKSDLHKEIIFGFAQMIFGESGPMIEYVEKIKNRTFDDAGFALTGGLKDSLLFEKAFADVGIRAGVASLAKESLMAAAMNGLGDKDWSALTEMIRLSAGLDSQAEMKKSAL